METSRTDSVTLYLAARRARSMAIGQVLWQVAAAFDRLRAGLLLACRNVPGAVRSRGDGRPTSPTVVP